MNTRSIQATLRATGFTLAVLLCAATTVRADSYTVTYNYDSSIQVGIIYTGMSSTQYTSPVPFSVTDNTTNSSFTGFCLDLYHDQYNNQSYTAPTYSVASLSEPPNNPYPYSGYTGDLDSRLNYMGLVYSALQTAGIASDKDVAGAFQSALWNLIDSKFTTTFPDTNMQNDYNAITALIGPFGGSGTGGPSVTMYDSSGGMHTVGISAYSTTGDYSSENGKLILVHSTPGDPGYNQNVIAWGSTVTVNLQSVVPEPSTFAIAALGALAFIGYGARHRCKV
jgi:hypothetical protein